MSQSSSSQECNHAKTASKFALVQYVPPRSLFSSGSTGGTPTQATWSSRSLSFASPPDSGSPTASASLSEWMDAVPSNGTTLRMHSQQLLTTPLEIISCCQSLWIPGVTTTFASSTCSSTMQVVSESEPRVAVPISEWSASNQNVVDEPTKQFLTANVADKYSLAANWGYAEPSAPLTLPLHEAVAEEGETAEYIAKKYSLAVNWGYDQQPQPQPQSQSQSQQMTRLQEVEFESANPVVLSTSYGYEPRPEIADAIAHNAVSIDLERFVTNDYCNTGIDFDNGEDTNSYSGGGLPCASTAFSQEDEREVFELVHKYKMSLEVKAEINAKAVARRWQHDGKSLADSIEEALKEYPELYERAQEVRLQFEFEKAKWEARLQRLLRESSLKPVDYASTMQRLYESCEGEEDTKPSSSISDLGSHHNTSAGPEAVFGATSAMVSQQEQFAAPAKRRKFTTPLKVSE